MFFKRAGGIGDPVGTDFFGIVAVQDNTRFYTGLHEQCFNAEGAFADMLDGAKPLVGYADGVAALALAEAAAESLRTGDMDGTMLYHAQQPVIRLGDISMLCSNMASKMCSSSPVR